MFVLSILVVACGSNADSSANLGDPPVTATIDMNNSNGSPTPTLPPYSCGAWATQTSPPFGTSTVGVYAKFVHNVKSNPNDPNDTANPQGIEGASAIATVSWADGTQAQVTSTTGADGLATFAVSTVNKANDINKLTFVTVQFTKDGVPPCTVDQTRAAFFTLTSATSEFGSPVTSTTSTSLPSPGPTATPPSLPSPGPTATPPGRPKPTRTPKGH
ncbi:MAG: hypothetical protein NVS4B11_09290 [Ktedonobacteraceae bacterium]